MKVKVNKIIWNVEKVVGKYAILKHNEYGTVIYNILGIEFIKEI